MLDTLTDHKGSTDVFQDWLASLPGAVGGAGKQEMAWRDEYVPEPDTVRELAWRDEYVPTPT